MARLFMETPFFFVCLVLCAVRGAPLICDYRFDDGGRCSVVRSETGDRSTCPELCLWGKPEAACTSNGVDCSAGAYFPCSWSSTSASAFSDEVKRSGEFSVAVHAIAGFQRACGDVASPGRMLVVGELPSCMATTNLMLGQAYCDTLIRIAGANADCIGATKTMSGVACTGVESVTEAWYDPSEQKLAAEIATIPSRETHVEEVTSNSWTFPRAAFARWQSYPFSVCNELSMTKPWCGQVTRVCVAAGEGSSELCRVSHNVSRRLPRTHVKDSVPRGHPEDAVTTVSFPSVRAPRVQMPPKVLLSENVHTLPLSSMLVIGASGLVLTGIIVVTVLLCRRKRRA